MADLTGEKRGHSLRQIAEQLNAEGHKPRRGGLWHPGTATRIVDDHLSPGRIRPLSSRPSDALKKGGSGRRSVKHQLELDTRVMEHRPAGVVLVVSDTHYRR